MTDEKQFNIVLESCNTENLENVTDRIASVFPIRKEMAMQLASSTPIVILDELTKGEANAVYSAMAEVVNAGAAIRVVQSDNLTTKMTKIKWPEKPKINNTEISELAKQAGEDAGGEDTVSKHVCPHCGNPLLVSMDQYGENITVGPDGEVIPMVPAGAAGGALEPVGPAHSTEDFILSNDDLIAEIEEPHIPKTEEITNVLDSVFAGADDGSGSGLWTDVGPLAQAEPLPPAPAPAPAPPAPAPTQAPAPVPAAQAPAPAAAGGFPGQPAAVDQRSATVPDQKVYNVFLPKLTSEDKKEKAIPLIVEVSGISSDEAKKLSNRIVIPLVKGVSKEEADAIKDKFMAIGILPRIRQQM